MKKNLLKIFYVVIFLLPIKVNAETNPFLLKFTSEVPLSSEQNLNTSNIGEERSTHPLLKYNLNRYFVKGTLMVKDGAYKGRALAIISAPGEADHLVQVGDSISDEWPQWTISKINLRDVIFIKRDGDELDENGQPIFIEDKIDVFNPLTPKLDN